MNVRISVCSILLWANSLFAADPAFSSHPAVLAASMINEGAPYPECHASTIVETAPGKLVAAWFGGTKERNPDVGIWVAHHENGRWLPAREVADGVQETGPRLPSWNPVLFQPPRGPLVLFYKVGPSPSRWWGMIKTSADGGTTWSAARRLPEGILGPVKNKPVILPDGSWLSASSTEGNPTGWRVHFELSRDQGASWTKIGPVEKGDPPLDMIQPSVLLHRDGTLQAMGRTRNGVIGSTVSRDGGKTWSPLAKSELPNPNSGTDAVTLADGRHLVVYNHSTTGSQRPDKGDRYPLDIAISSDGRKWQRVLTLESEPVSSGYAYPAVIQTSDGRVHVTYTFGRAKIKHVVLDPTKLP
jgi:predicted neuraminidase